MSLKINSASPLTASGSVVEGGGGMTASGRIVGGGHDRIWKGSRGDVLGGGGGYF